MFNRHEDMLDTVCRESSLSSSFDSGGGIGIV
jgi:hypothetical protein